MIRARVVLIVWMNQSCKKWVIRHGKAGVDGIFGKGVGVGGWVGV